MKINVRQAADILKVSPNTIRQLVKSGQLIDVATRKEGTTKHYAKLEMKDVKEFKKTYAPQRGPKVGLAKEEREKEESKAMGSRLFRELEEIKAMVKELLEVWK